MRQGAISLKKIAVYCYSKCDYAGIAKYFLSFTLFGNGG